MSIFIRIIILAAIVAGAIYSTVHWFDGQVKTSYTSGVMSERSVWQAKEVVAQAAEKTAVYNQAAADFAKQASNASINFQNETDHAKAITALKSQIAVLRARMRAAGGLRVPRSICSAPNPAGSPGVSPGTATPSNGINDAWIAASVELPAELERRLRSRAEAADAIVEDYRATQAWIRAHGFYGPVTPPAVNSVSGAVEPQAVPAPVPVAVGAASDAAVATPAAN